MTQRDRQNHDPFVDKVKSVLDASLEDLDAATANELGSLKHRALSRTSRRVIGKPTWGLVSVATVLLFMVMINWPDRHPLPQDTRVPADVRILTDSAPLDFYAEDIAFYLWLAENVQGDTMPPAPSGGVADDS